MKDRPAEETAYHTRIMKCTLEIEHSRAYWQHCEQSDGPVSVEDAFEKAIFGSRTYTRVERLMADMRHRFDAFAFALNVLKRWPTMNPQDRALICHWHMQLADPLYRRFSGDYLVKRFAGPRPVVDKALVVSWIEEQTPERWQIPSRMKIASKLMTSALSVGLLSSNRDPRPICFPRVSDTALTYLVYLLREVEFAGTMLENPYVTSVGLDIEVLVSRLRALPALRFHRQGELVDFGWQYDGLEAWAEQTGLLNTSLSHQGAS